MNIIDNSYQYVYIIFISLFDTNMPNFLYAFGERIFALYYVG